MPKSRLGSVGNFAKKNDWHMSADGGPRPEAGACLQWEAIDPRGDRVHGR